MIGNKIILYIGLVIGILTYLFWEYLKNAGFSIFYIGNALFIFSLALYIFLKDRKSFIAYVILGLSVNNLLDEIWFNPIKFNWSEVFVGVLIILLALFKNYKNGRKNK